MFYPVEAFFLSAVITLMVSGVIFGTVCSVVSGMIRYKNRNKW